MGSASSAEEAGLHPKPPINPSKSDSKWEPTAFSAAGPCFSHNNLQQQMNKVGSAAQLVLLLTLAALFMAPNWQASGFGLGGWPGTMYSYSQPNLPQVYVEIDKAIADDLSGN